MSISIFKNDKTTAKDELVISIFTLISLLVGIALVVIKPSLGMIEPHNFVVLGVLLILFAIMIIPCIIYRLKSNYKSKNKQL